MTVTKNIAKYVKDMGINISELSRKSGVAYGSLYASLGTKIPNDSGIYFWTRSWDGGDSYGNSMNYRVYNNMVYVRTEVRTNSYYFRECLCI